MFVTDKLVGSHRLPKSEAEKILDKGFIYRNDLKITRTNFRVENLANDAVGEDEIIEMFKKLDELTDGEGNITVNAEGTLR